MEQKTVEELAEEIASKKVGVKYWESWDGWKKDAVIAFGIEMYNKGQASQALPLNQELIEALRAAFLERYKGVYAFIVSSTGKPISVKISEMFDWITATFQAEGLVSQPEAPTAIHQEGKEVGSQGSEQSSPSLATLPCTSGNSVEQEDFPLWRTKLEEYLIEINITKFVADAIGDFVQYHTIPSFLKTTPQTTTNNNS